MRRSALLETVKEKSTQRASSHHWDIVETRLRFPRAVMDELKKLAADEGVSFNALMASVAEACLEERGRRSFTELAPWFADYLARKAITSEEGGEGENFE
jgi:predicted DNA-binding ribbon-helix-helix protein